MGANPAQAYHTVLQKVYPLALNANHTVTGYGSARVEAQDDALLCIFHISQITNCPERFSFLGCFVTSCAVELIVLVLFLLWFVMVIALTAAWQKSRRLVRPAGTVNNLLISVVVPVRNEEKHLPHLLNDLLHQTRKPHEIIVTDDHSTDQTRQLALQLAQHHPCIKVLSLPEDRHGKKAALQAAIERSSGQVIVTTDGDCRAGQHWLDTISKHFADEQIKMVAGPVIFNTRTWFGRLLNIEQLALQAVAAASSRYGHPLLCSGANMAFRKQVFDEVGGYQGSAHLASGDDVFLLHKIRKLYPAGILFCTSPGCTVVTQPPASLRTFLNQRIRWAGKWRLLGRNVQLLAAFVLIVQVIILCMPWMAMNWMITLPSVLGLMGVKCILEGLLVFSVAQHLHSMFSVVHFSLAQLIYPVYAVAVGLLSFRRKTVWKGRIISTR